MNNIPLVSEVITVENGQATSRTPDEYTADLVSRAEAMIAELPDAACPGAERIAAERLRQIRDEGYTPERDAGYVNGELGAAAISYVMAALNVNHGTPLCWPWSADQFKRSTPLRDLEKAGALIAAEIARRIRAGETA